MTTLPYWKALPLSEMSKEQWEGLCDGCARCCLQKLQDDETDEVFYTRVVCHYLKEDGQCSCYSDRQKYVPDCVWLTPEDAKSFHWLPDTCAYRLVAQGDDLPDWHPLISGKQQSVITAGISVLRYDLIPDDQIDEKHWQDHLIDWVQYD